MANPSALLGPTTTRITATRRQGAHRSSTPELLRRASVGTLVVLDGAHLLPFAETGPLALLVAQVSLGFALMLGCCLRQVSVAAISLLAGSLAASGMLTALFPALELGPAAAVDVVVLVAVIWFAGSNDGLRR